MASGSLWNKALFLSDGKEGTEVQRMPCSTVLFPAPLSLFTKLTAHMNLGSLALFPDVRTHGFSSYSPPSFPTALPCTHTHTNVHRR